ncbi:MAG: (deoxy)nucleoside triphosphate pyrophosphohydrolase [Hyphomonadaceae bacterium]|nr:(deoxy)nucleoside triphosphate pyrophosphohydrolase [Hyphomonadaceae bacterium]MBP9235926.1 (deoxy)nucleoside triphosphate pyrophosphohydrolase [Hyphomonadaceae bacterium]
MTQQLRASPLVLVAAVALVRSDGRLLLAQRPKGKAMAGLWEFPGGKVEAGESPQVALARELKEELGVAVAEADMQAFSFASHAYETFHLLMPVFLVRRWQGEIKALEGQQLAWVSAAEIRSYPAPEADLPLFERFIDWSRAGHA